RANRYIQVLEQERYIKNTRILEPAAFKSLIKAFLAAQKKALADCSLIKITPDKEGIVYTSEKLSRLFRTSDYIGSLDDGYLYVLLANTNLSDAGYVTERISEAGYTYDIVKEI
ncbi:MAG: NAD(P)-dependent oxidoreductase, partial [Lachnospira sp.]|nr:NAD(P)-dependent oxidoreductase [Lachnospira sp.]